MKKSNLLVLVLAALIAVVASSLTVYATNARAHKALTLPHTFSAHTTASASQVNDNFNYLVNAIEAGPLVYKTAGSFLVIDAGAEDETFSPNCDTGYIAIGCQCIAADPGGFFLEEIQVVISPGSGDHCACGYKNTTAGSGQVRAYAVCMAAQSAI